jgi:hypothetical protein
MRFVRLFCILAISMSVVSVDAASKSKPTPKPYLPIGCQTTPCLNGYLDQSVSIYHPECGFDCTNDQCYYYGGGTNMNCCTNRTICCTWQDSHNNTKYTYQQTGESVACSPQ